jgi:hypothetical protein
MARASLGLAFLLGAIVIVQIEGESYRRSLPGVVAPAIEKPSPPMPPTQDATPIPEGENAKIAPADQRTPEPEISSGPPPSSQASRSAIAEGPVASATVAVPAAEADVVPVKDALQLSPDEELCIGRAVNARIVRVRGQVDDVGPKKLLNDAAHALLDPAPQSPFNFTITRRSTIDAFSHIGGYVYVDQRVLDFIHDEVELEFVLAHQMWHIEGKHDTQLLRESLRNLQEPKSNGLVPVESVFQRIRQGYSEVQEYDADERAYRRLRELRRSRHECLAFPRRLMAFVQRSERDAQIGEEKSRCFSHPSPVDRYERLCRLEPESDATQ